MSLAVSAARGGMITVGFQLLRFAIQLTGIIVLGRLLGPQAVGLIAMVTAFLGVGDVIRDFGLSTAAVQAKHITHGQRSNLFWINTGFGVCLTVLFASLAPVLAAFYGKPAVVGITLALSIQFVFSAAQGQYQADLNRAMRYVDLSVTDVVSQFLGLAVAIGSAVSGAGYWALVAQILTQTITLLIGRVFATRWVPALPSRGPEMRSLLSYGSHLTLTQLVVYASRSVDGVLIGARFGAGELGLYSRAYQILMMPLNQLFSPLTSVALPVLSRLQDDKTRFAAYLQRGQLMVGYAAVMLFAIVGGTSQALIPLLLGEDWRSSASILQVLAVGGSFQAVSYVAYWVFLSKALTASNLRFTIVSRTFLILCLVAGSGWGPLGVATGYSFAMLVNWPLSLFWIQKVAGVAAGGLLLGGCRLLGIGAACGGAAALATGLASEMHPIAQLACGLIAILCVVTLIVVFSRTVRRDVSIFVSAGKMVFNERLRET